MATWTGSPLTEAWPCPSQARGGEPGPPPLSPTGHLEWRPLHVPALSLPAGILKGRGFRSCGWQEQHRPGGTEQHSCGWHRMA